MSAPTHELTAALKEMARRLSPLGVQPDAGQTELLKTYCRELQEYNRHTNLVSRADAEPLVLGHLVDSWTLVPLVNECLEDEPQLLDVGSGAGLPGLVLAIAVPSLRVTRVESVGKKSRFLELAAEKLGLGSRVTVLNARAEELGRQPEYRNRFDLATARAVGPIDLIAELTVPMLKVRGVLLAQKSLKQVEDETPRAKEGLPRLGARLRDIYAVDREVLLRDSVVLVVEKTKSTPGRYPRTAAQIKKQPLGEGSRGL